MGRHRPRIERVPIDLRGNAIEDFHFDSTTSVALQTTCVDHVFWIQERILERLRIRVRLREPKQAVEQSHPTGENSCAAKQGGCLDECASRSRAVLRTLMILFHGLFLVALRHHLDTSRDPKSGSFATPTKKMAAPTEIAKSVTSHSCRVGT